MIADLCWQALDEELDSCICDQTKSIASEYSEMLRYQLGWNGNRFDPVLTGKRVRPTILLLTMNALGGDWKKALPAAAAVELVHNFSLVHDDIQDKSIKRRGKETVWVRWGEAQAINSGDAILALAGLEILSLQNNFMPGQVLAAVNLLNQAVLNLTKGQYLDLANEKAENVSQLDYFKMVEGKTSALFSASLGIGALLAGNDMSKVVQAIELGRKLGLAFQIQDDLLGIWGENKETGKSVDDDLMNRKKTFPVQYALENLPDFREYWIAHPVFSIHDVIRLKTQLENARIPEISLSTAESYYLESYQELQGLIGSEKNAEELLELVEGLFKRKR